MEHIRIHWALEMDKSISDNGQWMSDSICIAIPDNVRSDEDMRHLPTHADLSNSVAQGIGSGHPLQIVKLHQFGQGVGD